VHNQYLVFEMEKTRQITSSTCRFVAVNLVFIFYFHVSVFANETDSLRKLLSTTMPDTARVNLLNALSKSYLNVSPDSAILIAISSKDLAGRAEYKTGLALAYKNMGLGYYMQGKYTDAIKAWDDALAVYTLLNDKRGVANMLSNQGAVFANQGDEAKSLEIHLRSLKMSEEIADTLRVVTSLSNIGAIYINKPATYNKALENFLQAYKLSLLIKDDYLIGTASVNLGETYFKLGDDATALKYLNESARAFKGTEDLTYTLNYIGRVFFREKKYDSAIKKHTEAYELSKNFDSKLDQARSLVALAQAYYAKGNINSSVESYTQALDISIPLNALSETKDAYEGLATAYSKQGDFTKAFRYQNLLLAVKDTIYNTNTDRKLLTLQFGSDLEKKESQISLLNKDKKIQEQEIKRQKLVKYGFIGGFSVVLLFAAVFFAQRKRIESAKKRSDELLLNILPEETAEELKATGTAKTKSFQSVTVLFTDFKNFTIASEILTPEELVEEINHCYSAFDRIVEKHGVEKIKTIGDSYMCAGGLPVSNSTHPFDVVAAGIEMVQFIEKNKQERIQNGKPYFELRLGIHTGPVVAGIVGIKKFAYDIWGDTVNTASRMESSGEIGKVNISGATYEKVKEKFSCVHRGKIEAKNKGSVDMYFVEGEG
jgi:adenylate cyclase